MRQKFVFTRTYKGQQVSSYIRTAGLPGSRAHDLRPARRHHHEGHDDGELRQRDPPEQAALMLGAE
jgi:hypothetical protein